MARQKIPMRARRTRNPPLSENSMVYDRHNTTTMSAKNSKLETYCAVAVKLFIAVCILGMAAYGHFSGRWEQFMVFSPLAIALIPGYSELLPRGGWRHGTCCECVKPNTACELGFWSEHGQRLFLFLPLTLVSIFLGSIFCLHHSVMQAAIQTLFASLLAIFYCLLCGWCFYMMVTKCNPR